MSLLWILLFPSTFRGVGRSYAKFPLGVNEYMYSMCIHGGTFVQSTPASDYDDNLQIYPNKPHSLSMHLHPASSQHASL